MPIKRYNWNHYMYRKLTLSIHIIGSYIGNKIKVETLQK